MVNVGGGRSKGTNYRSGGHTSWSSVNISADSPSWGKVRSEGRIDQEATPLEVVGDYFRGFMLVGGGGSNKRIN